MRVPIRVHVRGLLQLRSPDEQRPRFLLQLRHVLLASFRTPKNNVSHSVFGLIPNTAGALTLMLPVPFSGCPEAVAHIRGNAVHRRYRGLTGASAAQPASLLHTTNTFF